MEGDAQTETYNYQTACSRCRKQKLRCSREIPTCTRCYRLQARCYYPPPVDRKLLRARRSQIKRHASNGNGGERVQSSLFRHYDPGKHPANTWKPSEPTVSVSQYIDPSRESCEQLSDAVRTFDEAVSQEGASSSEAHRRSIPSTQPDGNSQSDRELLRVPCELGLSLIEKFFECNYQAHLLFDKSNIISDYVANRLPGFVLASIFAFASLFMESAQSRLPPEELNTSQIAQNEWADLGERWATYASQTTLMNVDQPCPEHIQACQILALFWFARNQTMRTNMHNAIAYRTCRLLGYDRMKEIDLQGVSDENELKRRLYWASWLTKCISQQNAHFDGDCWREVERLPLPCALERWVGRSANCLYCFDKRGYLQEITGFALDTKPTCNLSAGVMRIFGIWWEVQRFAKERAVLKDTDLSTTISDFYALDRKLEDFYDSLPNNLRHDQRGADITLAADSSHIFSLNYVYHLCVSYLHSSIVPAFSNASRDPKLPRKLTRLSAEEVMRHFAMVTEMTERFLVLTTNLSKLWAMVGYGASFFGTIQLRYLATVNRLFSPELGAVEVHLKLLSGLKQFWMPLENLNAKLEAQYEHAQSRASSQLYFGVGGDSRQNGESHNDLERVASADATHDSPINDQDIYTYIADEDKRETSEKPQTVSLKQRSVEVGGAQPTSHTASPTPTVGVKTTARQSIQQHQQIADNTMEDSFTKYQFGGNVNMPFGVGTTQGPSWWDQSPVSCGDFYPDYSLFLDISAPLQI